MRAKTGSRSRNLVSAYSRCCSGAIHRASGEMANIRDNEFVKRLKLKLVKKRLQFPGLHDLPGDHFAREMAGATTAASP